MKNNYYVQSSLELHLFFARIMKEHSFFLEVAFPQNEKEMKQIAREFQDAFSNILNQVIDLANGNITNELLNSNEFVTKNTLEAEQKSSSLTGTPIYTNLTIKELQLKSGQINNNYEIMYNMQQINRKALPLIENLIDFKNNILSQVLTCKLFTTNYPLLITHITNEAKMYYQLLSEIEQNNTTINEYEQQLFWDKIMKEHAEFIRGLLDPSEKELIELANTFANQYEDILNNHTINNLEQLSLNKTIEFQKFKETGENGILSCDIKSIIVPLLADHVLREANHFIRILKD